MPPLDAILLASGLRQLVRLLGALAVLSIAILWGRKVTEALGGGSLKGPDRLLIDLGLGFGLLSAVLRLIGFAGLFHPAIVWGVAAAGAFLPFLKRESLPATGFRFPFPSPVGPTRWALVALALLPGPLAFAPAVSWDALTYHLRTPERALATGFWQADAFNLPSYFPSAHGTLYALTLVGDPEGVAAQLLGWGFHVATLFVLARIGTLLTGPSTGRIAACLYASVPAAGVVASFAWADAPLVFSLSAAALALVLGAAPAALALLGLAAAVKYTGALFALPLGIAALAVTRRNGTWIRSTGGAALGVAIAAPWYVANALATGNPVYPLLPGLFGGTSDAAERLARWDASGIPSPLPGWLGAFWRSSTIDSDLGGPVLFCILAAGWLVATFTRSLRPAALLVALPAILLAGSRPAARVLLPLAAGLAVLAAAALVPGALRTRAGRLAAASVLALVVLRGAALVAGHAETFFGPVPAALGLEPGEAYARRNFPPLPLFRRAEDLPAGSRCLSVGEPRLFRFPAAASSGTWADDLTPLASFLLEGRGVAGNAAALRAAGFTHLLVTDGAVELVRRGAPAAQAVPAATFEALLAASEILDREAGVGLYALPPAEAPAPASRAGARPEGGRPGDPSPRQPSP